MRKASSYYIALVAVGAAVCLSVAGWRTAGADAGSLWNALASFAVLCFISEASYLRLRVGRTETQSSVAFIPYIATFLLFDSGWAAVVTGVSMLAVELGVRRKPPVKMLFNTSQVTLSICLAAHVFQLLGGQFSTSADGLRMPPLAVAAAVATYLCINSTAVSVVVTLHSGEPFRQVWLRIAGASIVYDAVASILGPALAYLYVRFQIPGILILVLPLYAVRHIYQINMQLEQVNRDLLELMVKAIEARDPYTSGHSQRVSELAAALAKDLGLGSKLVDQIRTAALLHDVGKIHEEYAPLLRKEGKLDATEKALMQTHATRSAELVGTISAFRGVIVDAIRHHHENYDGSGYPLGLAGRVIPVGARIIMIADTADAMTTDRPYRHALTLDRVGEELRRYAGKQFDPDLVTVFLNSEHVRAALMARAEVDDERPSSDSGRPPAMPWPPLRTRRSLAAHG